MTFQITADSTSDLSPAMQERYGVRLVPLYVQLGERTLRDGVDVLPADIYAHVSGGSAIPTTAAVSLGDYVQLFSELSRRNDYVIHTTISSEFSCTYQNACLAASEYPNVYVVDSRSLSMGHGILALEAHRMAKAGLPPEELAYRLRQLTGKIDASFIVPQLSYLRKGGRCSAVTALGANLLQLKPCIEVKNGKMGVGKKYRGNFDKCLREYITDRLSGRTDLNLSCMCVVHSGLPAETVDAVVQLVRTLQPFEEIHISRAGCTISSHCGPGTLGIMYMRK